MILSKVVSGADGMSAENNIASHEIVYDREKNRIYITAVGDWNIEQSDAFLRDYREALARTRPGFTVLSDVRAFKCSAEDVQQNHARAIKMDAEAGVKKVARVVGTTPLAGFQIKRISGAVEGYESKNFKTPEEAEIYLDSDNA
jgi:hypothetical protein